MTDGVTLLRYVLVPAPDPLQAGTTGKLTLAVSNMGTQPVDLTGVAITLPLGANADDLALSSDGIGTAVAPDGGWHVAHTEKSATFTFTPPGGKVSVKGAGYALELTSIAVNDQVGPVQAIKVVETASTASQPSQARTWTSPQLAKVPKGFSLSDLIADPVEVDAGGSTSLMWTATSGSYTMQRDDQPNTPAWPVGLTGPEVEKNLAPPRVTFSLVGKVDGQPVERQVIVGVRAKAPAINAFSAIVERVALGVRVTVRWDVANVPTCEIPELWPSPLTNPGEKTITPTALEPLPTQLTLKASNSAGSVTKSLHTNWAVTATATRVGTPSGMALSPDGKRLYVMDSSSEFAVLNALSLLPLCPTETGLKACSPLPSPDGTRLYFADPFGPIPHLQALDVTVLPPVPIGVPAPKSDRCWTQVITPDGDLVLVGSYSGSVEPFRTSADRNQPLVGQPAISIGAANDVALTPDGRRLYGLSGGAPATLAILDVTTLQPVGQPVALSIAADGLGPVAPDGSLLVFGQSVDAAATGLNKLTPDPPFTVTATWRRGDHMLQVLPSADGRTVYAVPSSGSLTPLSLATLTPAGSGPATPLLGGWDNSAIAQSPDGSRLYAPTSTGPVLMMPAGYG
jgi:hypothetical protein